MADINKWTCQLYVPKGTLAAYQEADQWKEFFFIIEGEGDDAEPVESLTLGKHDLSLRVGEEETIVAQIEPSTADNKAITWSSSNEQVASVDANGLVKALAAGEAWIKAVSVDNAEAKDSCLVAVTPIVATLTYIVDGEIYKTYEVNCGSEITPEAEPTKEGYTFSGWSEIPETMPDHDVTVTGSFIPNDYVLIYIVDGQEYKTYTVACGTAITPEEAPTKEGYTFSGWSEMPETMPAGNVIVMGTFTINQYKLTFIIDGEEYISYEIDYNTALAPFMPESVPAKKGMTFSGWGEVPETMPAYDLTLTGIYSWWTDTVDGIIYQIADTIGNYASIIGYEDISGEAVILPAVKIGEDTYTVNSIEDSSFSGCTGLSSVTIPEELTNIGNSAFSGCSSLTNITIPSSVTSIGDWAFEGCNLPNILVKCVTPPSVDNTSFTEATFYHAMLYIPTGSWYAYAFKSNWYKFINIRETTTEEEQLSMQQAYTLMDAGTFAYSVYDPVNDRISSISSNGIDENNPNHCWQVIEVDGERYLYNLGAKKFVTTSGNSMNLTSNATTIEMGDGKDGIVLGEQEDRQWAFVSNDRINVEDAIVDGIQEIKNEELRIKNEGVIYDLSGRQIVNGKLSNGKMPRGINIIRYSDGSSKKVLVK